LCFASFYLSAKYQTLPGCFIKIMAVFLEALKRIGEEKCILRTIQQRKHNWLGHVLRHDGMLITILERRTMGKGQRGRIRIQMIDNIVGKESYVKTKRKADNGCGKHQVDCP